MRPIPTTKSSTTSLTDSAMHSTTWHSPIPYLFGGLAAMLGLIAFALFILACSYWKLSGHHDDEETDNNNNNNNMEGKEQSDSANKETVKVYQEKILVIMAGDQKPTFLATPSTCAKSSSLVPHDGLGNNPDKQINNRETSDKSEKEIMDHVVQPSTLLSSTQQPQPQETTHEEQSHLE